jgi:hypothetical protein
MHTGGETFLFYCFSVFSACLFQSVLSTAMAGFLGTRTSNKNGHPYQKVWTLKKIQLFIEFPCIQLGNLNFVKC